MFQLFISISLDSLQESSECHLLSSSETLLLPFNYFVDLVYLSVSFSLFFDVTLNVEFFGVLVPLGVKELLNLLSHFHELFSESYFD